MPSSDALQSEISAPLHNFYAVVPDADGVRFLLLEGDEGYTLPVYNPVERHVAQVEKLNETLRVQLGLHVTVLYCAYLAIDRAGTKQANALYIMENHTFVWTPPSGTRWVGHSELAALKLECEWQRPFIEAWFLEQETGNVPPMRPPWGRRGWRERIAVWVQSELAARGTPLLGHIVQVKQWDISSVWRAATSAGDFYFKATPTIFAHEPSVTCGLAEMFPAIVPAPVSIASLQDQGWMLMPSFDGEVLWEPSDTEKEDVLRLLAGMQIRATDQSERLLKIGCLDRRVEKLAAQVEDLCGDEVALAGISAEERAQLRSMLPEIRQGCALLAAGPVPQTLVHGDFHGGNLAMRDGKYTLFDWTDGCLSHPFFDLITFLDMGSPDFEHLRDVYLAEWGSFDTSAALRAVFDTAFRVGNLHHALSYRAINAAIEEPMRVDLQGALEYYLRRFLASSMQPE